MDNGPHLYFSGATVWGYWELKQRQDEIGRFFVLWISTAFLVKPLRFLGFLCLKGVARWLGFKVTKHAFKFNLTGLEAGGLRYF